jgi:hypothetical protein
MFTNYELLFNSNGILEIQDLRELHAIFRNDTPLTTTIQLLESV